MPLPRDEHGQVILTSSMPIDVQGSDSNADRWQLCAQLASKFTGGKAVDDPEVAVIARILFNSPIPTHADEAPAESLAMQEAQLGFEHQHPRGRAGEFIEKLRVPKPPASPGVSLEDISRLGLDEMPSPTPEALKLLHGFPDTATRWHANRAPGDLDHRAHPPYKAARRKRHDLIVGQALAGIPNNETAPLGGIASLLGREDPITRKLYKGGRLSEAEKDTVRKAAHNARGGESPDALFMAGGPAVGKTSALNANPELRPGNSVTVNADAIKEQLPEFQKLAASKGSWRYAAKAVHHESGDIAERLLSEATDLGLNTVIDGTGNDSPEAFIRQLQRKHDAGYDVSVLVATIPSDEAVRRSVKRAIEEKRFVPVPVVREKNAKVSRNFPYVAKLPFLEALDVFSDGTHVATLGDGGVQVLDGRLYDEFLDKAKELKGA